MEDMGTCEAPADVYATQGQPTMREQGCRMSVLVARNVCTHLSQ